MRRQGSGSDPKKPPKLRSALLAALLLQPVLVLAESLPDFSHPDDPHVMIKNAFALPSQLDQFDYLRHRIGDQPLMVILLEFPDSQHSPAYTPAYIQDLLFGPDPSVNGYFEEVSHGRYSFTNAGVFGWFMAPSTAAYYFDPAQPNQYTRLAADAVAAAVAGGVVFDDFDSNSDGEVTRDELLVQMVFAPHPENGRPWVMATRPIQTQPAGVFAPGGLEIDTWAVRGIQNGSLALFAHELAHAALALPDLYGDDFGGDDASYYCLMSSPTYSYAPHISPWAKIHLGWIDPVVVPVSGFYTLAAVEQSAEAYVLYSPEHGADEYFIVENRWPESSLYEDLLPDRGLAVWHITEFYDDEPFSGLKGRKMVAMRWSGGRSNPLIALWDCSETAACYDLTDDSSPTNLRWENTSASGLSMMDFSEAGELMQVYFSVCFSGTERCDAMDNDCDAIVDDGFTGLGDPCTVGVGACARMGTQVCSSDGLATACDASPGTPSPEACDGLDNDCNGSVDEGSVDTDADGLADCIDLDDDNDLVPDPGDCAPLDMTSHGVPTEVQDVDVVAGAPTAIVWTEQDVGSGTQYVVVTGDLTVPGSINFTAGSCLITTSSSPIHDTRPDPTSGRAVYYLVKSRNACGAGTFGSPARDTHPACP